MFKFKSSCFIFHRFQKISLYLPHKHWTYKSKKKTKQKTLKTEKVKGKKLHVLVLKPREETAKKTPGQISIEKASIKKTKRIITITSKPARPKVEIRKFNEVNKHIDNARLLLLCSNATPIKGYGGIGYRCCFCTSEFAEARDLKRHTLDTHNEAAIATFMKRKTMLSYNVKLDITWLACRLCNAEMDTVENLADHLVTKHDKTYNKDIKSHIIPFKFDTEIPKCVICNNEFNNFKVLLEHMNTHFSNHVCEVCGGGFINRRTLLAHGYRHQVGSFPCSYCTKVYDTKVKQRDHERAVHICNLRNKCGYCSEKFSDYRKKKAHEVKVHGARPVILKCHSCSKIFDNQRALTVHTKTFHLMERRAPKRKDEYV